MKTTSPIAHRFDRATLYLEGGAGYFSEHVRDLLVEEGVSYAQYPNAVRVSYVKKGGRRPSGIVLTYAPSLVVVDGWSTAYAVDPMRIEGCVRSMRLPVFDPGWAEEFSSWLRASKIKPALDYRGYNTSDASRAARPTIVATPWG